MGIVFRGALLASALSLAVPAAADVGSGTVGYNGGAAQNFDGLSNTVASGSLPTGWYFREPATSTVDPNTYQVDDGSLNQGNFYSYGSAASTDRGLGILPGNTLCSSGCTAGDIGARIKNLTAGTLTSLQVAYAAEVWLYQGAVAETFVFEYSTNATSLDSGNWTAVPVLNLVTPAITGTGKKDGNQAANRAVISGTISGLSLPQNSDLWVRWRATNISGNDNGLAIDDVVFGTPVDNPPQLAGSVPANGANNVAVTTEIDLQFSEAVTVNAASITLVCAASPQTFTSSGNGSTYTITPDHELPYGSACTLTIPAGAVVDQDGTTLHPMNGDASVTFNTMADDAPSLTASTPAQGSTTFPANGSLQLTFSEPVAVGSTWFNIVCSTSGTRNVADTVVSGGPTMFTINPNADFVQGESCTLNLVAAQITDLDGILQNFTGPTAINFTPAAAIANVLPTVLSTTPMNNATNFPAAGDIVVLFSESVSLAANAFSISCATTTNIALSHNPSGTSFTVSLDKVLVGAETCVFTIDRTKVTDGEGANPAQNTVVNFTVATSSAGDYYDTVNDSDPEQLRCTLHDIIKDHTVKPYGWVELEIADEAPPNVCAAGSASSENFILDVYRNRCYPKPGGRGSSGASVYNREHTWPKSLGFGGDPDQSKPPSTDLHMLHLSAADYNSDRNNKPYDNCDVGCTRDGTDANNGVGGTMADGDANWYNANVFEVWDGMKGNMARAVMYMAIRYEGGSHVNGAAEPNLELTDALSLVTGSKPYMGKLSTLLQWHQQDPPDQREMDRNVAMQMIQGNRNPFVDHPEWATMALFTSNQPATCTPGSANALPIADDDSYNATEDTVLTVNAANGVLVGDNDPESAPMTAALLANALYGVVAMQNDGSFSYDPADDFCGSDTFTYRAYDGVKYSAAATVTLNVACTNDAPVAVGVLANQSYPVSTTVNLATASGFDDVDNDVLSYSATGLPASLSIDPGTGVISGTLLASDLAPPYAVVVTAEDPSNAEVTQAFSLTVTPAPDDIFENSFE